VRAASFSADRIEWATHRHWLEQKLTSPSCHLFLALDRAGEPIGQVRFDLDGARGVISVSLIAGRRSAGLGRELIKVGTNRLVAECPELEVVDAWIKPENVASQRAFEAAGYPFEREDIHTTGLRAFVHCHTPRAEPAVANRNGSQ